MPGRHCHTKPSDEDAGRSDGGSSFVHGAGAVLAQPHIPTRSKTTGPPHSSATRVPRQIMLIVRPKLYWEKRQRRAARAHPTALADR